MLSLCVFESSTPKRKRHPKEKTSVKSASWLASRHDANAGLTGWLQVCACAAAALSYALQHA